jgi:hypothetical protein
MPICITCKVDKPYEDYHNDARYGPRRPNSWGEVRKGRTSVCKPCKSAYDKARWTDMTPAKKAVHNDWKGKDRAAKLKKAYGITIEQYDEQLARQLGGCAICGRPPKSRCLDVDHDHKTGHLRGLLCHMCNRSLAYLRNSPETAEAAALYLQCPPWLP